MALTNKPNNVIIFAAFLKSFAFNFPAIFIATDNNINANDIFKAKDPNLVVLSSAPGIFVINAISKTNNDKAVITNVAFHIS